MAKINLTEATVINFYFGHPGFDPDISLLFRRFDPIVDKGVRLNLLIYALIFI